MRFDSLILIASLCVFLGKAKTFLKKTHARCDENERIFFLSKDWVSILKAEATWDFTEQDFLKILQREALPPQTKMNNLHERGEERIQKIEDKKGGERGWDNKGGENREDRMDGEKRKDNKGGENREDKISGEVKGDNKGGENKEDNNGGETKEEKIGGEKRGDNKGGEKKEEKIKEEKKEKERNSEVGELCLSCVQKLFQCGKKNCVSACLFGLGICREKCYQCFHDHCHSLLNECELPLDSVSLLCNFNSSSSSPTEEITEANDSTTLPPTLLLPQLIDRLVEEKDKPISLEKNPSQS